jgi:hypothetical protein
LAKPYIIAKKNAAQRAAFFLFWIQGNPPPDPIKPQLGFDLWLTLVVIIYKEAVDERCHEYNNNYTQQY